jgi:TRAP-type uncharacterized transport system fused permease subunit
LSDVQSSGSGQEPTLTLLWRCRPTAGKISLVVSTLMVIYHLLYISGALAKLGLFIMTGTHRALSLCFILVIVFLTTRASKDLQRGKLPFYNIVLLFMSLVATGYSVVFNDLVTTHLQLGEATMVETILLFLLLIALIEAGRRMIGWALPIIALFFLFHALFTSYFPGILAGRSFSLQRLTNCFLLGPEGIYGIPMGVASTIIVAFILFAEFLRQTGAGQFFLNLAMSLVGTSGVDQLKLQFLPARYLPLSRDQVPEMLLLPARLQFP